MNVDPTPKHSELLTPKQVALRLLEDAQLKGFRTKGEDGIVPVTVGAHVCYRRDDVQRFIDRGQLAA